MTGSHGAPGRRLGRPLAVALGVLGALTFAVAALLFVLVANARDFCDSTCNEDTVHLWSVLSATAIASSIVQVFAALGGSRRLALGGFVVTLLIAGILFVPLLFD